MVRAHFDADTVPWANCALSGWILDPDRKKMSKSVGNVQVPTELLERFGADAVRYWAACGRPGTDTAFDQQQFKIGRRLAMKLLNASKFVLRFEDADDASENEPPPATPREVLRVERTLGARLAAAPLPNLVTEQLDRSMLHRLADLVDESTRALEAFDYARALERTESFFWTFTDDHVELVKARAYGEYGTAAAVSARFALRSALQVLQQLFAPFMPFVAEEVWRWWHKGSVHTSAWPKSGRLRAAAGGVGALPGAVAAAVLGEVRRAKSEAKRPLRTEVLRATVIDNRRASRRAGVGGRRRAGRGTHHRTGDLRRIRVLGEGRFGPRGRHLALPDLCPQPDLCREGWAVPVQPAPRNAAARQWAAQRRR